MLSATVQHDLLQEVRARQESYTAACRARKLAALTALDAGVAMSRVAVALDLSVSRCREAVKEWEMLRRKGNL